MSAFLDFLQKIDTDVLLLINGAHTPVMDNVMWIISGRLTWIPLYVLFAIMIFRDYRKGSWVIYIFAVLAIMLSDQSSNLIKDFVMRLRPSHVISGLHFYNQGGENYMGGLYGFPSNHAANAASFAFYMMLLFRNKFIYFFLSVYVLLICYSRVYLGVHYPSDVLGGIVVGIVTGSVAHKVCMLLQRGTSLWDN